MASVYSTSRWRAVRADALRRDADRCTVGRLLGGACSLDLQAHHIEALSDGGAPFDLDNVATVCSTHHPTWEAIRRAVLRARRRADPAAIEPCRHKSHRSLEARIQCARQTLIRKGELDPTQLPLVKVA